MPLRQKFMMVTLISLAGLAAALWAIYFLASGAQLLMAFLLIITALLCDMLDGPLARHWGITSWLGRILDSISDVFVYLVFPSVYWYLYADVALVPLLVLVAAGTFRLVRFTIQGLTQANGSPAYVGMPVYYIQLLLAVNLLLVIHPMTLGWLLIGMAVLMISTVPFRKLGLSPLSFAWIVYLCIIVERFLYAP